MVGNFVEVAVGGVQAFAFLGFVFAEGGEDGFPFAFGAVFEGVGVELHGDGFGVLLELRVAEWFRGGRGGCVGAF